MKSYILIATFALAISRPYLASGMTTSFDASFDDLHPILEEGPITPVGIYRNLSYTSFYFSPPASPTTGLTPPSGPNYAYAFGAAFGSITASYTGSTVGSFAFTSFSYGCMNNTANAAAALPVACTVTATGYQPGAADPAAMQEFVFAPAVGPRVPMAFGAFDAAFRGLEHVTFSQSPARGTRFVVDDVVGTLST